MGEQLKILILEDNPADVEFIGRELRKAGIEFEQRVADSRGEFVYAIGNFLPDVILSDHSLPQFNSIEALKIAKEMRPGVPFLLVTGAVSEEFAVQVIKDGADDYILKDHLMRLPSAINNALKKKVAEREREEMLAQLLNTNNELNTFVYKATHDLRGPLTSIMGLANLAGRDENLRQTSTYVRMISECTQKLDEILVSLIETMAMKNARLTRSEIHFGQMLNNILERLEFTPGFERLIVSLKVASHKQFFSDDKVLNSILQNVIENSVKYQDRSNPRPYLNVIITDSTEGVKIEVIDNGIGIPPAIQDKIFDMFYRGSDGSQGSGLGLYLVKNGVQRLGGMIDLKSEPGKGTVFTIYLPNGIPAAE
jgi:signal transduction histidine kinase